MKKYALVVAVISLLALAQVSVQANIDRHQKNKIETMLYLPSGNYIKPLALGYNQMLADLLWIKTVAYFGDHFFTDKEYPWLFHMLSLIIELDPRYDFPYYFGGIVLSLEVSQVENANKILGKGMEAYPEKWEYPFYSGFNLYYHLDDSLKALPFIQKAADLPGSPPFVKTLVGTLILKSGNREGALSFYRELYQNTSDPMIRSKIEEKVNKIRSERSSDVQSH